MTIIPAGPRLAVVALEEEDKRKLILPPGIAGRPEVGVVASVGRDCTIGVEVGDKVWYFCNAAYVEDVKIIDAQCVVAYDDSGRAY